ncbi:hypothetical protein [Mucilaginibacter sp. dw_454]|uniref:hypothetical protein n=1 Tax=Mucilaginibacter sp. dw_454 TaxID=2720079 RepID=UPI001BD3503C|nr:hypothetical protein [Mucilaginibacter sp. dw_454]
MRALFFMVVFGLMASACVAQTKALDIPGLLQLVSYSKSENSLQNTARNDQAVVTANETANRTLLVKMKTMYRTLQNRYSLLGTAISAAQVGLQAEPMVSSIISSQSQLYGLAQRNPAIVPLALQTEIEFAEHSELLINYMTGLILSIGDVNQMKSSDRKLLFDYVLSELSNIQDMSNNLVRSVQYANLSALLKSLNPFQSFVSQDTHLVNDIITNAKYLRK